MTKTCIKCRRKVVCSDFCRLHFVDYFEKKVRKTIRRFKLLDPKEKICVAVSGGKDSTVALYILNKLGYKVEALTVDANIGKYTQTNLENIRTVCKKHKIKLHELSFKEEFGHSLCYIRDLLRSKGYKMSSCMVCGVLRRHLLNRYSKESKFDCIVTGHNLDDEAQTFVMNVFRNDKNLAKRQGPVSGFGKSTAFVKRVKPLYMCTEEETTAYSKLMNFPVQYTACPCRVDAYRKQYLDMLDEFERNHPSVKYNIVNFFLDMIYPLKSDTGNVDIHKCEICGGPSAKEICKKCEIILTLKKAKK